MPLAQPKVTLPIDLDRVMYIEELALTVENKEDLTVYVVRGEEVISCRFHAQVLQVSIVPQTLATGVNLTEVGPVAKEIARQWRSIKTVTRTTDTSTLNPAYLNVLERAVYGTIYPIVPEEK